MRRIRIRARGRSEVGGVGESKVGRGRGESSSLDNRGDGAQTSSLHCICTRSSMAYPQPRIIRERLIRAVQDTSDMLHD